MNNKIIKKTVSGLLLCTMCMYTLPVLAVSKDETVYSKLDVNGKKYNTIVSTKLENEENQKLIKDLSDLLNIENTNGDETFTKDGNSIIWNAEENNIYYQGESSKQLPIECNVIYKLNGETIAPEEIVGKSGEVKVILQYVNKDAHTININGKNQIMYTPFVVVAGTIIQNDKNSNITVSNGKTINDGSKTIVMGIAMPGLQESLNISKNTIDIPSNVEISMTAEDFELNSIATFVTPKVIENGDLDIFNKLDEIYSKVQKLESSTNQLAEGAESLKQGASDVNTGADSLKTGVSTAASGVNQIKSQVDASTKKLQADNSAAIDDKTLSQIENQAATGATLTAEQKAQIESQAASAAKLTETQKTQIENQAASKSTLTKEQKEYIENKAKSEVKLSAEEKTKIDATAEGAIKSTEAYKNANASEQIVLLETAKKMAEGIALSAAQTAAVEAAVEAAQIGATTAAKVSAVEAAQTIAIMTAKQTALTVAQTTATTTAKQTATVTAKQVAASAKQSFTNQTVAQMKTLSAGLGELKTGMGTLNKGANDLANGTKQVSQGATTLSEGINTFNEEGIKSICKYINGDLKNLSTRIEELSKLADKYDNFTMLNDGQKGSVKFIMIIDSLKKENYQEKNPQAIITNNEEDKKEN